MKFNTKFDFDETVFPVELDDDMEQYFVGEQFLVDEVEVRIGGNGVEDEIIIDMYGNRYEANECFASEKEALDAAIEFTAELTKL